MDMHENNDKINMLTTNKISKPKWKQISKHGKHSFRRIKKWFEIHSMLKVMEQKYTQTHLLSLVGKTLAEMQGTV